MPETHESVVALSPSEGNALHVAVRHEVILIVAVPLSFFQSQLTMRDQYLGS